MKQVSGINRVTLKTNKSFVLYIDNPDILSSAESSYVIFGEAKFLDFTGNLAGEKAQNFQKAEQAQKKDDDKVEDKAENKEAEDDGVEEDQGDIPEDKIKTLIEYSNMSRNKAIRALKKAN